MKKIFLTSALAISMIVPAMAETTTPDIAAGAESASCDSGTLNTTDGTSTLSAQWTANTITLKFYSDDTTTPFATNTCTYDGGITLPASAPRRTGYNFAGWQVKQALINLADYHLYEEPAWDAELISWSPLISTGYTTADDFGEDNSAGLNAGEWTVKFSNGTVKGMGRCSTTPGEWLEIGNPADSGGGQYCWCGATSYDVGNSGSFANVSSTSWVFDDDHVDADNCANGCAFRCANYVRGDLIFQSAVFGVSGN